MEFSARTMPLVDYLSSETHVTVSRKHVGERRVQPRCIRPGEKALWSINPRQLSPASTKSCSFRKEIRGRRGNQSTVSGSSTGRRWFFVLSKMLFTRVALLTSPQNFRSVLTRNRTPLRCRELPPGEHPSKGFRER